MINQNGSDGFGKRTLWSITTLGVILAVATVLRLTRLGYQSQWNDEAISAVISGGTTEQILTNKFHSLHPPGYYLLLHFWRNIFGDSDFILRLPSALMGIFSVITMYLLGKILFNSRTGLWAAAITALMPFHLFYSQEMRMYSLLFLLASLGILCQAQIWRKQHLIWWGGYLVFSLLGLYTHYFFVLIVGTLGLYFFLRRWFTTTGPPWIYFWVFHILLLILYSPIVFWLEDQLSQSSDYWIEHVSLAQFLSVPLVFTVGQFLNFTLLQIGYGVVLTIIFITLLQVWRVLRQKTGDSPALVLVLMTYGVPVLIVFGVSIFWTPLTQARLMMVAVPGLYLLLAWGAAVPKERVFNVGLVVLLMMVALVADYNWLFNASYSKPPVREAAHLLKGKASPQEMIIYTSDSGFRLFGRYTSHLDHRLFLENNDNSQVHPEVIRLMGGDIVTFADPLSDTFWLVLHQDFDAQKQEDIFNRFDQHYLRLDDYVVGNIRMYQYRRSSLK